MSTDEYLDNPPPQGGMDDEPEDDGLDKGASGCGCATVIALLVIVAVAFLAVWGLTKTS